MSYGFQQPSYGSYNMSGGFSSGSSNPILAADRILANSSSFKLNAMGVNPGQIESALNSALSSSAFAAVDNPTVNHFNQLAQQRAFQQTIEQYQQQLASANPFAALFGGQQQQQANPLAAFFGGQQQQPANPLAAFFGGQQQQPANPFAALLGGPQGMDPQMAMMMQMMNNPQFMQFFQAFSSMMNGQQVASAPPPPPPPPAPAPSGFNDAEFTQLLTAFLGDDFNLGNA